MRATEPRTFGYNFLVTTRQHPMSNKHDIFLTHGEPPTPGNPSTVPLRRCYGDSTASRVPTIFVLTWTWSLSLMTVSLARFLATVFFVRFFARFFRFLASLPAFVWQLQHQEVLKEKEFLWARTLRLACISTDVKISILEEIDQSHSRACRCWDVNIN